MVKYIDCPKCGMSFSVTDKELDSEQIECPYCNSVIQIRKPKLSFGQGINSDNSEKEPVNTQLSIIKTTEGISEQTKSLIEEEKRAIESAQEYIPKPLSDTERKKRIAIAICITAGLIIAICGIILRQTPG